MLQLLDRDVLAVPKDETGLLEALLVLLGLLNATRSFKDPLLQGFDCLAQIGVVRVPRDLELNVVGSLLFVGQVVDSIVDLALDRDKRQVVLLLLPVRVYHEQLYFLSVSKHGSQNLWTLGLLAQLNVEQLDHLERAFLEVRIVSLTPNVLKLSNAVVSGERHISQVDEAFLGSQHAAHLVQGLELERRLALVDAFDVLVDEVLLLEDRQLLFVLGLRDFPLVQVKHLSLPRKALIGYLFELRGRIDNLRVEVDSPGNL